MRVDVGRWVFGEVKNLKGHFDFSPGGEGFEFDGELLCAARIGDEGDGHFCVVALCEGVEQWRARLRAHAVVKRVFDGVRFLFFGHRHLIPSVQAYAHAKLCEIIQGGLSCLGFGGFFRASCAAA